MTNETNRRVALPATRPSQNTPLIKDFTSLDALDARLSHGCCSLIYDLPDGQTKDLELTLLCPRRIRWARRVALLSK